MCVYFILFTDIGVLKKTSCLVSVVPEASLVLPGGEVLSLPKQEAAEEAQVICQISKVAALTPLPTNRSSTHIVWANYGINGQAPHVSALAATLATAQQSDNNINRKCWHIKNKSMPLCLYQLARAGAGARVRPGLSCPGVNYFVHMLPRRGY